MSRKFSQLDTNLVVSCLTKVQLILRAANTYNSLCKVDNTILTFTYSVEAMDRFTELNTVHSGL